MIELRITGEDAYDFSTQVASIATIFDISTHPWDYTQVLELIQKQHAHKAQMASLQKGTVVNAVSTIEPDHHNYSQPAVSKPAPAPAPKPAPTAPAPAPAQDCISLEALQHKCCELGEAYGQPVFQELKKQSGFVSMKKLTPEERQSFAELIDQYFADHPQDPKE